MMAHICSIIGIDFETTPQFQFVVNKFQKHELGASDAAEQIIDYLRFEILKKDYSEGGIHYNIWSLRGVQENMPPITRPIPDFYAQTKIRDKDKDKDKDQNLYKMYKKYLEEKNHGL